MASQLDWLDRDVIQPNNFKALAKKPSLREKNKTTINEDAFVPQKWILFLFIFWLIYYILSKCKSTILSYLHILTS